MGFLSRVLYTTSEVHDIQGPDMLDSSFQIST